MSKKIIAIEKIGKKYFVTEILDYIHISELDGTLDGIIQFLKGFKKPGYTISFRDDGCDTLVVRGTRKATIEETAKEEDKRID